MEMKSFLILALCVSAIAALSDWRRGRIPNVLTLGVLVAAPAIHIARVVSMEGWGRDAWVVGIGSLIGAAVCAFVPFILFLRGGVGAGDVKLLAAMGAVLGARVGIEAAFYSFVMAGIVGLGKLAYEGRLFRSIKTAAVVAVSPTASGDNKKTLVADMNTRFAMGPSVLVGMVVTAWLHWRTV